MTAVVGGIVYEVGMDISQLIAGSAAARRHLESLNGATVGANRGLSNLDRQVNTTGASMSKFSVIAGSLMAYLSAQKIAEYADAWTVLNNKVSNSIRSGESQADVMQRVFDISQATQSSLNGTATLYARLERGTRTLNTSSEDLARLTTIINQGFAVSGATTQEAENAIVQLSQGLAAGALRGEEFNSVSEQGSRLMIALADSLGVGLGELRAMAAQGKLTNEVIVNGLLSQGNAIGQEFAKTTVTISQGLLVAGNNITKFFGENSTVKAFAAIFRDSVVSMSENIGSLSAAILSIVAVMGGRFIGSMVNAAKSQVAAALSANEQAVANNRASQAALVAATSAKRKAVADKEAALSAMALAQAEYNVAKGSAAEKLALDALTAAKTRATVASIDLKLAEDAQAAASTRAAAAARASSAAFRLAGGALSLIGGPAGFAMIAAGALFYFWQKSEQAREGALRFADGLDRVNESLQSMNNTKLRGTIADANTSIAAQKGEVAALESEVATLTRRYSSFTPEAEAAAERMGMVTNYASEQEVIFNQLGQKTRDLSDAKEKLARTSDTAAEANRILTNNMLTAMGVHDGLIQKGTTLEGVQTAVAKAFGLTADEVNRANAAGQNFKPASLEISPVTKEGTKFVENLREQNELLSIQDLRQRAITKARLEAQKTTSNRNQILDAENLAAKNFDLQQAEEARKKAQSEANSGSKREANQAETVAIKLEKMKQATELATSATENLSREQAILRAQQSLGKGATEENTRLAGEYAAIQWDAAKATQALSLIPALSANQQYQSDIQALQAALNLKKIDQGQYYDAVEKRAAEHQTELAKIQSEQAVSPVASARGEIDPIQQLKNQNAQKLELMKQYQTQEQAIIQANYAAGNLSYQQYIAAKTATDQQYLMLRKMQETDFKTAQIAAQWEILGKQNEGMEILTSAFDSASSSIGSAFTGILTGANSTQEAVASIATTVLGDVVNSFVKMGTEWVKAAITGGAQQIAMQSAVTASSVAGTAATTAASTTAAATTTAAWTPAAIVASIGSFGGAAAIGIGAVLGALAMNVAGKRKNGGPVNAGSMYQVGENGLPEIFQASNGSQYMIPGDNGRVISNKDMGSGGGGVALSCIITSRTILTLA